MVSYSLKWNDVDFDNKIIKVERSFNFKIDELKDTKAGYWRSVPISSELRSLLLEIRQHSQSEFILSRLELWRSGVEPVKVMKICGWKDLKTLAIYLRLAGVDEKGATEELSFLPQFNDNILSLHS